MFPGDGDDDAGVRGLYDGAGFLGLSLVGNVRLFQELSVEDKADDAGHAVSHGERQPEVIQPEPREQKRQRHEQHHGAHHAGTHRLKEHRKRQRGHQRNEADADQPERVDTYFNDEGVVREHAEQLLWNELEAQRADEHQRHAEYHRGGERLAAAVDVPRGVVEAYHGHDAGLH